MRLTGPLLDRIVKAVLHAFDCDDLVRVVRIYLDEDLETIVSGDKSYDMQVFALVRWAEKQTRVPELLYYLGSYASGSLVTRVAIAICAVATHDSSESRLY